MMPCITLIGERSEPSRTTGAIFLIGERERAYLVVQLARFFCIILYIYIYICRALHIPKCFYVNFFKRNQHSTVNRNIPAQSGKKRISLSVFRSLMDSLMDSECSADNAQPQVASISSLAPARQQCPAFA